MLVLFKPRGLAEATCSDYWWLETDKHGSGM